MKLLLFPHQLFEPSLLKKTGCKQVHLIEHTLFYGERKYKYIAETKSNSPKASPMKFNKRKLVFHRATMLAFLDECKQAGINIVFHEQIQDMKKMKSINAQKGKVTLASIDTFDIAYFDPVDHELQAELNSVFPTATRLETPYFLFTNEQLLEYLGDKAPSSLSHAGFYTHSLKVNEIPYITKSYDTENRGTFTEQTVPPMDYEIYENKYLKKAIQWVDTHYPKNPGSTDSMWLPIMRSGANHQLKSFLKTHLKHFGKYQDAMVSERPFLYHSRLSALLNIGLLTPRDVLDETIKYYRKNRTRIPIASFEGFIRQVAGWREYERLIYITLYADMVTSNIFTHTGKLGNEWYTYGNKNAKDEKQYLTPLNDAIDQAWEYGYLHHIYRLMVVANGMNLMGVHPYEAYRWFMEFAVDSYDWVMIGNVYSMGMWADGGKTMRKPYLSSNAYIEKMSIGYNEKEWGVYWRALFYNFLQKHEKVIGKTIYARNLGAYKKMGAVQKRDIRKQAKEVIRYYVK